jgi:predicted DsbA family dithiol-disulfide isomerase
MKVEIWSDVVCPWCYIGKRRFETALSRFDHADQVEIEWKSFELDPSSERSGEPGGSSAKLAVKYGLTPEKVEQMQANVAATAAGEGLDYDLPGAIPANTFDAHQVIHLAAVHGKQGEVKEALLRAHFVDAEAVGERDTLVRIAADAGLDPAEVREALDQQTYAEAVRTDEAEARSLGINGVPFFVVDRAYGVSGAQPAAHLLQMLSTAWAASNPLTMVGAEAGEEADGTTWGPDGCAI